MRPLWGTEARGCGGIGLDVRVDGSGEESVGSAQTLESYAPGDHSARPAPLLFPPPSASLPTHHPAAIPLPSPPSVEHLQAQHLVEVIQVRREGATP